MKNEEYINWLTKECPNLSDITCDYNQLHYKNQVCLLTRLNVSDFINCNKELIRDMRVLSSQSFFDIINCHLKYFELENLKKQGPRNIQDNHLIKNIRIVNRSDKEGFVRNYVYFIDENDKINFFENNSEQDILEIYNQLLSTNYGTVTERDLQKQLDSYQLENTVNKNGQTNKKTLIDIKQYQQYLTNNNLNQKQNREILNFEEYIFQLYKYQKYLLPRLLEFLQSYLEIINQIKHSNTPTIEQLNALHRFENFLADFSNDLFVSDVGNSRVRVNNQAGYFNGFILIGLVILLGLMIGIRIINLK